ncbi:uncharacterized protein J7T54_004020 [Emericellopsis cladophorae]|uniref:Uncharacterized protein n=1 Tax=Emericellopsis cladophorae TaxID=2686198 RepID=A0A9Q0BCX0_9HYPO|nr:uncharacterized protein J7T54_004020 [Emericellopsis cladophorae]KAI6781247.1 hypothetical protein J7T54_004020 [Emericellopsis cladophorae]
MGAQDAQQQSDNNRSNLERTSSADTSSSLPPQLETVPQAAQRKLFSSKFPFMRTSTSSTTKDDHNVDPSDPAPGARALASALQQQKTTRLTSPGIPASQVAFGIQWTLSCAITAGEGRGVWSWAWDIGKTPYAPPELEDDPTLPIPSSHSSAHISFDDVNPKAGRNMAMSTLPPLEPQWTQAVELIDAAHAQDPNVILATGAAKPLPYELHYASKMTSWLAKRAPQASPTLQLTKTRWELPRSSFPMGRSGYLTWRSKQKSQASAQVFDLLGTPSITPAISEADKERVALLVRKGNLTTDDETQILEDVACLVFLDDQFDDFERKADLDEEKMINILRKTWGKMSESGRQLALGMELSEKAKTLIGKALQS